MTLISPTNQQLCDDINAIRETAGVPPYQYLPDRLDPVRASVEHLFGADVLNITPFQMQWLQLEITDREEDAMPQYDTKVVYCMPTPDSIMQFYFNV